MAKRKPAAGAAVAEVSVAEQQSPPSNVNDRRRSAGDEVVEMLPTLDQLEGKTLPKCGIVARVHRSRLTPADYNPREIDHYAADGLRENIARTGGLVDKVIWNRRTGRLVGGHQRIEQQDKRKGTRDYVEQVVVVDWDEALEIEQNVALNNTHIQGRFDVNMLDVLAKRDDIDIFRMGFNPASLETTYLDAGVTPDLMRILGGSEVGDSAGDDGEGGDLDGDGYEDGDGDSGSGDVDPGTVEAVAAADEINEQLSEADAIREREKTQQDTDDAIQAIKDRRQEYRQEVQYRCDTGISRTLIFPTSALARAFSRFLQLPEDQERIDGIGAVKFLELEKNIPEIAAFLTGKSSGSESTEDETFDI